MIEDIDIINRLYTFGLVDKIAALHITEQKEFSDWWNLNRTSEEWFAYWEKRVPILANLPYYQTCGRLIGNQLLFPQWMQPVQKEFLLAIFRSEL